MVLAGSLVEALVLFQFVVVAADFDAAGIDVGDLSGASSPHDHRAVPGDFTFHPGADDRRFGDQQRDGLSLHVRTHQRSVGVVVLQKRNQTGRYADHLAGRDIHVIDLIGLHDLEVAADAGDQVRPGHQCAALDLGVGRRDVGFVFLIGPQPDDVIGDGTLFDAAVGRDQESVIVHPGVDRQRTDQADVRAFRRFDRADSTVV